MWPLKRIYAEEPEHYNNMYGETIITNASTISASIWLITNLKSILFEATSIFNAKYM